ncbi:MAG: glycosyltransferase family 39 protein [Bryobacteraceae bacterium]|jgi:4-amino-4-deoxy-L-arabinose transferase-like glycosyltransferase
MSRPSAIRFYLPLLAILLALMAILTAFLPMPGIQEDEALFLTPFLKGHAPLYSWTVGNRVVPVMLMDYVGALKTWIYWPVFKFWKPGVWSIRLPVCFFSMLTVGVIALFLRRVTSARIALLTSLLLATDAPFVLTSVFDWGPVCLLLLATALFLLLFQRFTSGGSPLWLSAAFLLAGLATWQKALFVVILAALALAWLLVFPTCVRRWMRVRNVLVAAVAFLAGSAPLIAFNLQRSASTFTAGRYLPPVAAREKLMMLQHTLDGRALEHYMFRSVAGEKISLTEQPLEDRIAHWYKQSSFHPASLLLPALVIALLALPFLRTSATFRALLFSWIAFAAAEAMMLLYRDAGAGPHHTVLLYPAPQFLVAATICALAELIRTPLKATLAVWAIAFILAGANLWLLHGYSRAGNQNGFSVIWTNGDVKLASTVTSTHLPVAILDWGLQNPLQIATNNQVGIVEPAPVRPGVLYVGHCDGYIIDESRSRDYLQLLRKTGVVTDPRGAPLFCLFGSRN